jgi:hypothetical protein
MENRLTQLSSYPIEVGGSIYMLLQNLIFTWDISHQALVISLEPVYITEARLHQLIADGGALDEVAVNLHRKVADAITNHTAQTLSTLVESECFESCMGHVMSMVVNMDLRLHARALITYITRTLAPSEDPLDFTDYDSHARAAPTSLGGPLSPYHVERTLPE